MSEIARTGCGAWNRRQWLQAGAVALAPVIPMVLPSVWAAGDKLPQLMLSGPRRLCRHR